VEDSKPILVLKTGEALPPVKAARGDYEEWIARGLERRLAPGDVEVAAVHLGDPLPDPAKLAAIVVTGSAAMVSERAPWSERSAAWLAAVVRADAIPVIGLCYGHQLIAHGLGGEVGPNPNGREMGTVDVHFAPNGSGADAFDPLFVPGVFRGHTSHVEAVLRTPRGARVLARTALDPHSVLRYGPRQWGTQFHPEFDAEILRGYVEARREILAGEGHDPDAMLAAIEETPDLSRVLARFSALVSGTSRGAPLPGVGGPARGRPSAAAASASARRRR
jgi:GMP synthase (glutamine-hydrolysing)